MEIAGRYFDYEHVISANDPSRDKRLLMRRNFTDMDSDKIAITRQVAEKEKERERERGVYQDKFADKSTSHM